MTNTPQHPQAAEVARLLAHLAAHGFAFVGLDDGGDEWADIPMTPEAIREHICGVDDSTLFVQHPDAPSKKTPGKLATLALYIVLGNGPGELVNDHSDREPLTSVLNVWSDAEIAAADHISAGTTPTNLPPLGSCHDVIDAARETMPWVLARHAHNLETAARRAQSHAEEVYALAHLAALLDYHAENQAAERRGIEQGRAADYDEPGNKAPEPALKPADDASYGICFQLGDDEECAVQVVKGYDTAARITCARNRAEIEANPTTTSARAIWSFYRIPA